MFKMQSGAWKRLFSSPTGYWANFKPGKLLVSTGGGGIRPTVTYGKTDLDPKSYFLTINLSPFASRLPTYSLETDGTPCKMSRFL